MRGGDAGFVGNTLRPTKRPWACYGVARSIAVRQKARGDPKLYGQTGSWHIPAQPCPRITLAMSSHLTVRSGSLHLW